MRLEKRSPVPEFQTLVDYRFIIINQIVLVNVHALMRVLSLWSQCEELAKEGALIGSSPADVVKKCPITIAMLADPSAALAVTGPSC